MCQFRRSPILPPPSDMVRCGTKTNNRTLMATCCGEAEVEEHLGCFMHCATGGTGISSDVSRFIDCVSTGGNANAESQDVQSIAWDSFCQGELRTAPQRSSDLRSSYAPPPSLIFFFTISVMLLLCGGVDADCTVAVEDNSTFIRQGKPRDIGGAGVGCTGPDNGGPENYCSNLLAEGLTTNNRTIDGNDASDSRYDSFFEVLGRATTPPRLFPPRLSFTARHWEPVEPDSTTFTWWAAWNVRRRRSSSMRVACKIG